MNFRRIFSITIKELLQLKRDKKMFPLLLTAPIIQLIILGYAATFDIKHIPTGVLDQDNSFMSRQYTDAFSYNGYFNVCYRVKDRNELCRLLDAGEIKIGLDIPIDFEKNLRKGVRAQVHVLIDGSDSNGATIGLSYVSIISQKFSSKLVLESIDTASFMAGDFLGSWRREIGKTMLVDDAIRIWYNPALQSKDFFVPGVICMILLIVTTNLTALSLVKEKEIGTLEQLLVTPIRPSELLMGKLIPFILIGFVDVAVIIVAAVLIFDITIKGSIPLLFLFSGFFLFTTLGLGIFISTVCRTQEQSMIVAFFFILNMNMLCGVIFPIENMPQVIQWLTYLLPLRYFAIIVRGIFLKGVGIEVLWDQALFLLLLGITIFSLSLARMRKKIV
ncbi:MAG: ABC transporter permease [Proteobacteria bacterium]|nr:ABC transporter permease [Pseudomonadota bacterium]